MTSLALILNPQSRSNRAAVVADQGYPVLTARPCTREELARALDQFAARHIRTLAIDGGDGTVREVVSVLPEIYGVDNLPELAILPSGYTNVIAADVGTPGRGRHGLGRLIGALNGQGPGLRVVERPVLEICRRAGAGPKLRGFFFGAGAFTHATQEFYRGRRLEPVAGALAVGLFMGASILRAFLPGARRTRWTTGDAMSISIDGEHGPQERQHFLVLATTLRKLVFRLWPFWGGEGEGLRWLDIDAPPNHLLRAVGRVMRGKPQPWMHKAGYRSGSARRLSINLQAPFILDGETFDPGPAGVELSLGPTVRFLAP